jgi:hypothetical protein
MVDVDALPPAFSREYGCTPAEWARWMREAVTDGRAVDATPSGALEQAVGEGLLRIQWRALEPRVIALVRLPRLAVDFRFDGVTAAQRAGFMRRLDLLLQRGGG